MSSDRDIIRRISNIYPYKPSSLKETDLKFMNSLDIEVPKHPNRIPGFTMGYRYTSEWEQNQDIPGPGAYDISSAFASSRSGIKFAASKRFSNDRKDALPGPGSYMPTSQTFRSKSKSDSASPRERSRSNTPPKISRKTGTFPKARRPQIFPTIQTSAGPGAYDIRREFGKVYTSRSPQNRTLSQGVSPRQASYLMRLSDTPGPGAYQTLQGPFYTKIKKGASFGTAKRDFLNLTKIVQQSPPGETYYKYNQKSEFTTKHGPKAVIPKAKRLELADKSEIPGPGQYDVRKVFEPKKGLRSKGTFGVSAKFYYPDLVEKSYEPGPGEYDTTINFGKKGISFTKSSFDHAIQQFPPGPGYYTYIDEFTEKKLEIERRIQKKSTFKMNKTKHENFRTEKSPNGSFEKAQRANTEADEDARASLSKLKSIADLSPAKGKEAERAKQGILYKESFFEEIIDQSISPGPKYYIKLKSIQESLGEVGPRFAAAKKTGYVEEEIKKNIPGPGAYNKDKKKTQLPVTFATSKRKENVLVPDHAKYVPGVGKYETEIIKKPVGGVMTKAQRNLEAKKEDPKRKKKNELDDFFFF